MGYNYNAKGQTYTEEEERLRWENVHLAGHKRYNFGYQGQYSSFYDYQYRGKCFTKEFLDGIFYFETDDIEECYAKIKDFVYSIAVNFPLVLGSSTESNIFFGVTEYGKGRGSIEICDNVGTNNVKFSWDDIVMFYQMLKVFGLGGEEETEETD